MARVDGSLADCIRNNIMSEIKLKVPSTESSSLKIIGGSFSYRPANVLNEPGNPESGYSEEEHLLLNIRTRDSAGQEVDSRLNLSKLDDVANDDSLDVSLKADIAGAAGAIAAFENTLLNVAKRYLIAKKYESKT